MAQKSTLLKIGLAIGGFAGLAIFLKNYVFDQKSAAEAQLADPTLTIEKTRQLMQEIKYQMLIVCVNFAEKMSNDMMMFIPQSQIQPAKQKLREAILKNYQNKQRVILEKHNTSKDSYASSLLAYESDPFLTKNKNQIFLMMEKSINGQCPILDVHPSALTVHTLDQMRNIYQQMCLIVCKVVWNKMYNRSINDPTFNPSDDQHFKSAIRQINIYQLKAEYLQKKGYLKQWGCPNEEFLKATEFHNLKNPDFKLRIRSIEKAYNKLVDIVSNSPLSLKEADIQQLFMSEIKNTEEQQRSRQQKRKVTKPNKGSISASSVEIKANKDETKRTPLERSNKAEDFDESGQKSKTQNK